MFACATKSEVARVTNRNDKTRCMLVLNKLYRGAKSNGNRDIVDHDQGDATIKSLPSVAT